MNWRIIGKKTTEGLFVFLRLRKNIFSQFWKFPTFVDKVMGMEKGLALRPNKFEKRQQLLKAVKKMLCGQVSKEEKKGFPLPKKMIALFFSLWQEALKIVS